MWSVRVDTSLMAHNQSNLKFPNFTKVTLTRSEAIFLLTYDAKKKNP